MAKNEIRTQELFTELGSSELKKELKTVVLATEQGKKSAWIIAQAYSNIVNDEMYADDFENLKEFADYVGVSKATISQYTNAVAFVSSETVNYSEPLTADTLSVGKAYLLSTLKDDLGAFLEWCSIHDRSIIAMSDKGLKNTIKEWKEELDAVEVEAEAVEVEAEADDVEAEELEEVAIIDYEGKKYIIPLSVLKEYEA